MIVVGDLEADGLLNEATRVWCGVFIEIETGKKQSFGPDQVPWMLAYMDTCPVLVFHNGISYDFPLLKKLYGYEYKGVVVDTLLMSRLQDPDRKLPFTCKERVGPHSIAAWGYRVGRGKPDHTDWTQYTPEMLHRCAEDTEILRLVYAALKEEGGEAWREAHKLTHQLFTILHEQEQYGWLVDRQWIDKSISMLTHWIDRIDRAVIPRLPMVLEVEEIKKEGTYNYVRKPFLKSGKPSSQVENSGVETALVGGVFSRITFRPVSLDSNKETKDLLLDMGWMPEKWNYKKDKAGRKIKDDKGRLIKASPVLNGDDPFIGVDGKVGKLIAKRVQARHRRSNLEGWLKIIREDGRISQGIAGICTTARLKHRGIVNVPGGGSFFGKWMRKAFIAKEGYKIVGVDADSCQLRMLASCMGDDSYTQSILNGDKSIGTDIHSVNQGLAGLATRAQAKTFIYGFLFGAGDAKIGEIVGRGAKEGRAIKEKFLSKLPKLAALLDKLTKEWRKTASHKPNDWGRLDYYNGVVTGIDGRPIAVSSEHQILVYLLQNMEAVLMQHALVILDGWLVDKGWTHGVEYGYVATIHDEIQAEVRDDCVEEYSVLAEEAIAEAGRRLQLKCPQKGEADAGINWYETH